jgi:hypothetical protein
MQTLNLMKTTMESSAQGASDDIGNFLQGDETLFGGKASNKPTPRNNGGNSNFHNIPEYIIISTNTQTHANGH